MLIILRTNTNITIAAKFNYFFISIMNIFRLSKDITLKYELYLVS